MLHHALSVSLVTTLVALTPLTGQIPKKSTISGATARAVPVTHIIVGNPVVGSADRQVSVAVGAKLREHLGRVAKKDDWNVITREKMNTDLIGWGFSADEIVSASRMRTFAASTGAQVFVTSELEQDRDKLWVLTSRITGMTYTAGHTFRVTQDPNSLPQDLGEKMAKAMKPALDVYGDAKTCYDQTVEPKKREDAVKRAYKTLPNFGMVTRCLADAEYSKDSTSDAAIAKMREVLIGDSLSFDSYHQIAKSHLARYMRDSSKVEQEKVVQTYQEMLRVAPNDQVLLEQAVAVFHAFGHPDAADQVAAQMLELDPASLKGLDLRSNACISRNTSEGFRCAVDALEQFYDIDSAQAFDPIFFQKITFAAKGIPDTARLERWAARGVASFPNDVELHKMQGYAKLWRGDLDGTMRSFQSIAALDSDFDGEVKTLVKVVMNEHLQAKRLDKAFAIIPEVRKIENQEDLLSDLNTLVIGRVTEVFQAGQQDSTKADPAQVIALADGYLASSPDRTSNTGKQFFALANMYRGYSILGGLQAALTKAETSKSCADYRAMLQIVEGSLQSLSDARGVLGEQTDASLNGSVTQLGPFRDGLKAQIADPKGCTP